MAEVLGLVASGLSVAQVAGSIVTNSLKLKALLDEVKDAPDNLGYMLNRLQLLAPVLCETTPDGGDAAGTNAPLPSASANAHLQQAMQNALAACQAASEQLQGLVTDLMSQVNTNRGGLRRKSAMVKIVLKKGTLAQYEMRLQNTIQLLTLAQSSYIVALQRTQPEAIVSQLMSALSQCPQSAALGHAETTHDQALAQLQVASKPPRRRASNSRTPSFARSQYLQMGLAKITGLLRVRAASKQADCGTSTSSQEGLLRIEIQMPRWLCNSVFDAVFSRSYAGWACSLNVYSYIRRDSDVFRLIEDALRLDDLNMMFRLFQDRKCGPLDHILFGHESESGLLERALLHGAWQVARYLLDYDSEEANTSDLIGWQPIRAERIPQFEHFLQHDELSDTARIKALHGCGGDLNSFTDLVSRLWPHNEFYEAGFLGKRLNLATTLVRVFAWKSPVLSHDVFHHLCQSLCLEAADTLTVVEMMDSLAYGVGQTVWLDPDTTNKWHIVILDVISRLKKSAMMPEEHPYTKIGNVGWSLQLFRTVTPFTNLFLPSFMALPGLSSERKSTRHHKMDSRLSNCARAAQIWLQMLQECGIDLLEYGNYEKRRLMDEEGCDFRIFQDVWDERWIDGTKNGLFEIRLINFNHGSQVEDWKLWWSEPTDELVGDFWREMEPGPLCMPGSWVED
ncbi:hypothetical protein KVR01_007889 [Diaporthe batatas]|uniref:uncharacterized protein n=1 Tax=Diaporthe batatas TaxID=748121 RepID=UPI001D040CCD|nr:uncharacterized protein KVR01_007889 [Diaporthe batatas]KAG8162124.1 hypothetical protein KVR01_007889 [Diaporthe batatas]